MAKLSKTGCLLLSLIPLLLIGCDDDEAPVLVPVQGIVLLNGRPLPEAQVRFIPMIDQGSEYLASGQTDAQGRFTLTCAAGKGASIGENRVLIVEGTIPPELLSESAQDKMIQYMNARQNRPIPKRYAKLATSPLRETVTEGASEYRLELTRSRNEKW